MKSYRPDVKPDKLVVKLCDHFKLDIKDVTYIEQIEMVYIYNFAKDTCGKTAYRDIIKEVKALQATVKLRGKRKRLYRLFYKCQATNMENSGRYDKPPLAVPIVRNSLGIY